MLGGDHLRKSCGFGGVFFVTAPAEVGDIGKLGLEGAGIVCARMLGLGTMAGFASDVGVLAGSTGLGLIVMTHDAGILPGVADGMGADQVERARPVVAVLAEILRDDGGPNDQKETHGGNQHQCRPDQVYPIVKATQDGSLFLERLNFCLSCAGGDSTARRVLV